MVITSYLLNDEQVVRQSGNYSIGCHRQLVAVSTVNEG